MQDTRLGMQRNPTSLLGEGCAHGGASYTDRMKVFISIKYHIDHANQPRLRIIRELARMHGMDPVCIADRADPGELLEFDPHELMRKTFLELRDSKLVVVDLTEKGVGVGIEAGYARARGIPIVTIAAVVNKFILH